MFRMFEKINSGEVYIIAEMSANHGGKLGNALKIVRKVAEAGADCLKIQTYTADSITINCDSEDFLIKEGLWDGYKLYDLYKDAGTPYAWQSLIKNECVKCGIDFLSTPFDKNAVDFLEDIGGDAYKIASFEIVDTDLIEYAASKNKPIIISCGMATEEEIRDALNACKRVKNDKVILLKCCSEYPAKWENMHLSNIPDMIKKFGVRVGLSDHSPGSFASIVAVSKGACVIEKHVKLDGISSADSDFSMPIDDFADMVKDIKLVRTVTGDVHYGPSEGERENLKFRRSLFAICDINAGEIITDQNIRSIRPSSGLKPKYKKEILGKKAKVFIKKGTPLRIEMFE